MLNVFICSSNSLVKYLDDSMESYKFLNPQVCLHIINNIKFISYLTENSRHMNYEHYSLNIFSLLCCKPHETHTKRNTLHVKNVEFLVKKSGTRI